MNPEEFINMLRNEEIDRTWEKYQEFLEYQDMKELLDYGIDSKSFAMGWLTGNGLTIKEARDIYRENYN